MGNRASNEERKKRDLAKDEAFRQAQENVKKPVNFNALTRYQNPAIHIQQAKETQLERKGKSFNKADLIALLIRLNNLQEDSLEIFRYQTLSNDDLRAFIRLKVYTPEMFSRFEEEKPSHDLQYSGIPQIPPPEYVQSIEGGESDYQPGERKICTYQEPSAPTYMSTID